MPEAAQTSDPETPVEEQSSSDKSLTGATPTPTNDEGQESAPTEGDEGQGEGAPAEGGAAPATPQGDGKKPVATWVQKRIDQLTWEKNEERRTSAALAETNKGLLAELEKLRTTGQAPVAGPDPNAVAPASSQTAPAKPIVSSMSEAEIEARVLIRAREVAAKEAFDKACNNIADAGKAQYSDFGEALRTFDVMGGIPQGMLDAIVDNKDGHKILYAVGKDPELADKIIKMPAARMGMELARIEASLKPAPKPVSRAGVPITPIETTTSGSEPDPEKMSTGDWVKWREKTKKTRW